MMRLLRTAISVLALTSAPLSAQTFSPDRIHADVSFLADDQLEGRGTGTRGHDLAALYVAERFAGLGLTPGNGPSWYQPIPFVASRLDPAKPSALTINGQRFANLEHVVISAHNGRATIDESAPVI